MPQDAAALRITLSLAPVIPVIILDDVSKARPLAEALVAGGLPVLEVTLRTPNALRVIEEMAKVPGAVVGSGTVRSPLQMGHSVDAGLPVHGLAGRLAAPARGGRRVSPFRCCRASARRPKP